MDSSGAPPDMGDNFAVSFRTGNQENAQRTAAGHRPAPGNLLSVDPGVPGKKAAFCDFCPRVVMGRYGINRLARKQAEHDAMEVLRAVVTPKTEGRFYPYPLKRTLRAPLRKETIIERAELGIVWLSPSAPAKSKAYRAFSRTAFVRGKPWENLRRGRPSPFWLSTKNPQRSTKA
jgi:hypothetical protein